MKNSVNRVAAWFFVVASAATQSLSADTVNIDFQLTVQPNRSGQNFLNVYQPGTAGETCKSKNHSGCYDVPQGDQAVMRVGLTNGDVDCQFNGSYRIKEVILGGEGDVNNPPPKPGADGWGNLSEVAARDFDADPVSGRVKARVDGNALVFNNRNSAPYSIWYKVVVEPCKMNASDRRSPIEFDPRIDNRGRPGR